MNEPNQIMDKMIDMYPIYNNAHECVESLMALVAMSMKENIQITDPTFVIPMTYHQLMLNAINRGVVEYKLASEIAKEELRQLYEESKDASN